MTVALATIVTCMFMYCIGKYLIRLGDNYFTTILKIVLTIIFLLPTRLIYNYVFKILSTNISQKSFLFDKDWEVIFFLACMGASMMILSISFDMYNRFVSNK